MRRLAAIIGLTWKAAFRYRLFWVLALLLLGAVVALPALVKDDGTARGLTQILLTYTLGVITTLLGLATLWLSCGTLARDIEEAQIQMLAVKPVARWQIWLGKWLGLLSLNAALLAVAGSAVYGLLLWRAQKLPEDEQAVLRNEIFVARGSIREAVPDLSPLVESLLQERLRETRVSGVDIPLLKKQLAEQVKAEHQIVMSGYARRWEMDLGWRKTLLRGQPLFMRVKFESPDFREATALTPASTYRAVFAVGPPGSPQQRTLDLPSVAAGTFHEFAIPPDMFDGEGKLTIEFYNHNRTTLLFPLEDSMEVLYREGGFGPNFARGLGIIWCWLALLAAVGLCAAGFLTFPVASFFSASLLLIGLSAGLLSSVAEDGTVFGKDHHTDKAVAPVLDSVLLPVFKGALAAVRMVESFSPVEALSSGRSIGWDQLGLAFLQVVVLFGGVFAAAGIAAFNRRELAAAQVNS